MCQVGEITVLKREISIGFYPAKSKRLKILSSLLTIISSLSTADGSDIKIETDKLSQIILTTLKTLSGKLWCIILWFHNRLKRRVKLWSLGTRLSSTTMAFGYLLDSNLFTIKLLYQEMLFNLLEEAGI